MIACNSSYYKREELSFISSEFEGFERSIFFRTNSCKFCKVHYPASGFQAQPGLRKVSITKF